MTGFSATWLALREPADHRARNAALQERVVAMFAGRSELTITDLGCGSGSNLRALAPQFGPVQHWRLVDHDPALLTAARHALSAWAGGGEPMADGGLRLQIAGRRIEVEFLQADLAVGVQEIVARPADLITAAAFFDLVSAAWIARFAAACRTARRPLYTVLTYDGTERWSPPHAADAQVLAAFHAHQGRDKGFGPAAGPEATGHLQRAFAAQGWRVEVGESPWRLATPVDAALMDALAEGAGQAVAETGQVAPETLAVWRAARRAASACEIGHLDLFAHP